MFDVQRGFLLNENAFSHSAAANFEAIRQLVLKQSGG
jgi:hypothetical protein